MAMKYSSVPVVAAPFGMVLGGGAEVALHANQINAHAETFMGLVEIKVGESVKQGDKVKYTSFKELYN